LLPGLLTTDIRATFRRKMRPPRGEIPYKGKFPVTGGIIVTCPTLCEIAHTKKSGPVLFSPAHGGSDLAPTQTDRGRIPAPRVRFSNSSIFVDWLREILALLRRCLFLCGQQYLCTQKGRGRVRPSLIVSRGKPTPATLSRGPARQSVGPFNPIGHSRRAKLARADWFLNLDIK
jgi:hypothetical protein